MSERGIVTRKYALEKGLSHYFTGRTCKYGHIAERPIGNGYCSECNKESASEWRENNRDRHRKEAIEYYWNNSEKVKARESARYHRIKKENPEKLLEQRRSWRAANPDKARASGHRRRARVRNAGAMYTKNDIDSIYKMQKKKCAYCRTNLRGKYQIDHIHPLIDGGTNNPNNIQLLCALKKTGGCNQRKGSKDPMDFARSLGLLL